MGLLQRRSPNDGSLQPGGGADAQARPRKGSFPSQKRTPSMPDDSLQKRKSFVNMFRSLRKDEVPPKMPVPSLPIGPAPVSILRAPGGSYANGNESRASLATNGGPPPGLPGGSTRRNLPGPGVCSSLPPPRPSFSHPPNHRQYAHSPSGSVSSTMSAASGARRPMLSISSPIPGIGDVPPLPHGYQGVTTGPSPIQTTMSDGKDPRLSRQQSQLQQPLQPLLPSQQMPPPPVPFESSIGVAVSAPPPMLSPRASGSSESMPLRPAGAAAASATGGGSMSNRGSLASPRQRVQSQPHQQQHSDYCEDLAPLLPPLPSSQPQPEWRVSSLSSITTTAGVPTPTSTPSPILAMPAPPKRNSEQDFIFDARVAAMLSDPPLPLATVPFTRIKPSGAASTTALAQWQRQPPSHLRTRADSGSPPHARPTSELRMLPPGALLSRGESLGVSSRPTHPRAFVNESPRPDSLLSTASWASAADGEAVVRIRRRTSASGSLTCSVSDSVSVFGESVSGGMDDSVEDLKTVDDTHAMPIRVRGNNEPLRDARNSLIDVQPSEPMTPKSSDNGGHSATQRTPNLIRHTPHTAHTPSLLPPPSSFMANMVSPGSMYSSSSSAASSTTDIHEGVGSNTRTPTASRTKLLRTPSAAREIDTLRARKSVLEVTNAKLEADLRKARSNGNLQENADASGSASGGAQAPGPAATSFSSMRTKRDSTATARTANRDSALTIRDEGPGVFSLGSLAAGARSQHDLAVPALLSEIELLKRSGAALQAELQAVKSQVSLLFPPTPAEMAEREALEGWAHRQPSPPGIEQGSSVPVAVAVDRNPFRVSNNNNNAGTAVARAAGAGVLPIGTAASTGSVAAVPGRASPSSSSLSTVSTASASSSPLTPQTTGTAGHGHVTASAPASKRASRRTSGSAWGHADKYTPAPAAQFGGLPPASRATVAAAVPPPRHPRPMSSISSVSSVSVLGSGPPPPRTPRRASRLPVKSVVATVTK